MGNYCIGGVDLERLARKMGTPMFLFDEAEIVNKMKAFKTHFVSNTFATEILYASKAFTCRAIYELARDAGFSLDVVSGGELHCAIQAGFPAERIYMHGNNKSEEEIRSAFAYGIGGIIIDDQGECEAILRIADEIKRKLNVMIRINPGIEAHTHKYIITAHLDSKFGIDVSFHERIANMVKAISANEYVTFRGFHSHIGSQIFGVNAYQEAVRVVTDFVASMKRQYGIQADWLNFGGGFAARYTDADAPIPVADACAAIIHACESANAAKGLALKKVMIEPGRSIVAEAGYTLYTAGYIKTTPGKTYVFVDGGMADNIRPALYGAKYECINISKPQDAEKVKVTIAGKCCESGDILIEGAMVPRTDTGDLLLFPTTGAYGYTMASNYNRLPRPAVVFLKDGNARCVMQRESYSDMERLECDDTINFIKEWIIMKLQGSIVALVTPFREDGGVDYEVLEKLIEWHIANKTDALLVLGTTGESSTMTHEEDEEVCRFTVEKVHGRIPVIAGSGSNCTQTSLEKSLAFEAAGVDGLLLISPYYNKTNTEGMYRHFATVADRVNIPIIIYNVPGRTGCSIPVEVVERLSHHKNIMGIKEASGNISYSTQVARCISDEFAMYSGNDDIVIPLMALGASGVISVSANIIPAETHDMVFDYLNGDVQRALDAQLKYLDLINTLFIEVNPIPIKEAMNLMGMNAGVFRLPLYPLTDEHRAKLEKEMKKVGLV